jgi:hypothetical protein
MLAHGPLLPWASPVADRLGFGASRDLGTVSDQFWKRVRPVQWSEIRKVNPIELRGGLLK